MSKGANAAVLAKIEASANEPVFLYEFIVDDTYHRFAGNQTADIEFPTGGTVWKAAPITHDPIEIAQDGRIDETTIHAAALSSELISYLTQGDATINGYQVNIYKVFRDALGNSSNYIVEFSGEIDGGSFDGIQIAFHIRRNLGTYSKTIPNETYGVMCPLEFKGTGDGQCNYSGPDATCARTPADCLAKTGVANSDYGNIENFGGFPWVISGLKG